MSSSALHAFAIKSIGSLAGAAISVAVWRPRSVWDGVSRLVAGVLGGIFLGPLAESYLKGLFPDVDSLNMMLAGACLVGALIWPVVGTAYRVIDRYKVKESKDDASKHD